MIEISPNMIGEFLCIPLPTGCVLVSGSAEGLIAVSNVSCGLVVRVIQDHRGAPITDLSVAGKSVQVSACYLAWFLGFWRDSCSFCYLADSYSFQISLLSGLTSNMVVTGDYLVLCSFPAVVLPGNRGCVVVAGCQWGQKGESVECWLESRCLPSSGLALLPWPYLCPRWHKTQEGTQGHHMLWSSYVEPQLVLLNHFNTWDYSVVGSKCYVFFMQLYFLTLIQCQYELLPPSLARFSPSDPDTILYTGYGLEKCVQFYSISQKTVLRTYAITHWATCMDVSLQGHLIALGCPGMLP